MEGMKDQQSEEVKKKEQEKALEENGGQMLDGEKNVQLFPDAPAQLGEEEKQVRAKKSERGQKLVRSIGSRIEKKDYIGTHMTIVSNSQIRSAYGKEFKEKSLIKSRESKMQNKKSRLYKKAKAQEAIKAYEEQELTARNERAVLRRNLLKEHPAQREKLTTAQVTDLSELAYILHQREAEEAKAKNKNAMEPENEIKVTSAGAHFADLVKKYSGVDAEGNEVSAEEKEEGRMQVMVSVAKMLMSSDVGNLNLFDDGELSANTSRLEENKKLLATFRRMTEENPQFMEYLTAHEQDLSEKHANDKKNRVKSPTQKVFTVENIKMQLDRLTLVDDLYRVRKLIVKNPYYMSHYNEELSMNAEETDSYEKRYLAKLLRTSFYLGKNLQSVLGREQRMAVRDTANPLPATDLAKAVDARARAISRSPEDWMVDPVPAVTDEQTKEQKKKRIEAWKKTYRAETEALLTELEHEEGCIPDASMEIDLKNVGKLKPTAIGLSNMNYSTQGGLIQMINNSRSLKEKKRKELVERELDKFQSEEFKETGMIFHIGVKSKRLKDFTGGNSISREVDSFGGMFGETMTVEEIVEMTENIAYSHKKGLTDAQKNMAEDMFIAGYTKYVNRMHQGLRMLHSIFGDKFDKLSIADVSRVIGSNMRIQELIVQFTSSSTNIMTQLPYEFLKKYAKEPVGHLKDFEMLALATTGYAIPGCALSTVAMQTLKMDEDGVIAQNIAKRKDKITALEQKIAAMKADGATEEKLHPFVQKLNRLKAAEANKAEEDTISSTDVVEYMEENYTKIEDYNFAVQDTNMQYAAPVGENKFYEEVYQNSSYYEGGKTKEEELAAYESAAEKSGQQWEKESVKRGYESTVRTMLHLVGTRYQTAKNFDLPADTAEELLIGAVRMMQRMGYDTAKMKQIVEDSDALKTSSQRTDKERADVFNAMLNKHGLEPLFVAK
ncbi:MAG: hypothetical protein K6G07_00820 [Lachnospiraceae bacterium]|nr:hypothetical protein [Lachnospiraceae bacterium]